MVDPERVDADPDPTFQSDAVPKNLARDEKNFLPNLHLYFQNLTKLDCAIFSVTMREKG